MSGLLVITLTLVGAVGAAVAWTERPARQAVLLSLYGVLLTVLFVQLQAPDVALSQVAVGSAVVPLMVLLTDRTVRTNRSTRR